MCMCVCVCEVGKGINSMVMDGKWTFAGDHDVQFTDVYLQQNYCTPVTCATNQCNLSKNLLINTPTEIVV